MTESTAAIRPNYIRESESPYKKGDKLLPMSDVFNVKQQDRGGHRFIHVTPHRDGSVSMRCGDFFNGFGVGYSLRSKTEKDGFSIDSPHELWFLCGERPEGEEVEVETFKKVEPDDKGHTVLRLGVGSGNPASKKVDVLFMVKVSPEVSWYYRFEGHSNIWDYESGNSNVTPTFKLDTLEKAS